MKKLLFFKDWDAAFVAFGYVARFIMLGFLFWFAVRFPVLEMMLPGIFVGLLPALWLEWKLRALPKQARKEEGSALMLLVMGVFFAFLVVRGIMTEGFSADYYNALSGTELYKPLGVWKIAPILGAIIGLVFFFVCRDRLNYLRKKYPEKD